MPNPFDDPNSEPTADNVKDKKINATFRSHAVRRIRTSNLSMLYFALMH
jgi:hypothetical protein